MEDQDFGPADDEAATLAGGSDATAASVPRKVFIPPLPDRADGDVGLLKTLGRARRNFLEIFPKAAYGNISYQTKALRRPVMLINGPEMVQEAFLRKHAVFQRKSAQMRHALEPLLGDGLFISDGEVWERRRKIVAPIIHTSRIAEFLPTMIAVIEARRQDWLAQPDGRMVDLLEEMARLTAEVICKSVFGSELSRDRADAIVGGFRDYQKYIDQIDLPSLLGMPDWLPRYRGRIIRDAGHRILKPIDDIIAEMASAGADDRSVVGALLKARDADGKPMSRAAIRNEAAVIFMAGYETTAATLSWAFYLLSQVPGTRKRLQREVDTAFGDRKPTLADMSKLVFTRAVVEETLRLYPPVPLLAREAMADTTLNGKPVKKGTLLIVSPWLMHRNPKQWKMPNAFLPARFLPDNDGELPGKFAYLPFSIGPRVCAGLTFGLTEAILALAMLSRSFDVDLVPGTVVQPVCRLTLRPGDTLPMLIKRRAASRKPPARTAPPRNGPPLDL